DPEQAARFYRRALDLDADDPLAARQLARLYESRSRWSDLGWALEQELARNIDAQRKIALLTQPREVPTQHPQKIEDAAKAFEQILAIDANPLSTLRSLAEIYAKLGKQEDLTRVLDSTAGAVGDSGSRAEILIRKGELAETRGDHDAAVVALRDAF